MLNDCEFRTDWLGLWKVGSSESGTFIQTHGATLQFVDPTLFSLNDIQGLAIGSLGGRAAAYSSEQEADQIHRYWILIVST